jgi:hypothetical protein
MAVILIGGLLAPRRQQLTRQPDRNEKTPTKPVYKIRFLSWP